MTSLVSRIAEEAAVPIARLSGTLFIKAALFILALASAGASAALLTIALLMELEPLTGALYAMLIVGVLYLVVAIALASAVVLWKWPDMQEPAGPLGFAETPVKNGTQNRGARNPPAPEMAHAFDRAAAPLLDLLHEQGMDRERLALAAGVSFAKELKPLPMMGVVLALGIALGHFARRRIDEP
jgi:hypothetical protein